MKILKLIISIFYFVPLFGTHITKEGVIPSYCPYGLSISRFFLPFNPTMIFVGEKTSPLALETTQILDCSKVFCFTPDSKDYTLLNQYSQSYPNILAYFGLPHDAESDMRIYYEIKEQPLSTDYRFSGSLYRPLDLHFPFLFGNERLIPITTLSKYCSDLNISKVHLFYLDCGGSELKILESCAKLVKEAIVIHVKTYHQPFRENLFRFEELQRFMNASDFILMTHHIYDNLIGDALYVKRKYFRAVFNSKEM